MSRLRETGPDAIADRVVWRWVREQRAAGRFAADQFPIGEIDRLAAMVAEAMRSTPCGRCEGSR